MIFVGILTSLASSRFVTELASKESFEVEKAPIFHQADLQLGNPTHQPSGLLTCSTCFPQSAATALHPRLFQTKPFPSCLRRPVTESKEAQSVDVIAIEANQDLPTPMGPTDAGVCGFGANVDRLFASEG